MITIIKYLPALSEDRIVLRIKVLISLFKLVLLLYFIHSFLSYYCVFYAWKDFIDCLTTHIYNKPYAWIEI